MVGIIGTWAHSVDDVLLVQMVYANENGNIMQHHPSFFEIKSQLCSSGSNEYHKKHSTIVIKRDFYAVSSSYATPLLGDGCFVKIGRNKFIQMDGISV